MRKENKKEMNDTYHLACTPKCSRQLYLNLNLNTILPSCHQNSTCSFYYREPLGDLYRSRRLARLPNQHLTYERDLTWVGDFQSVQCVFNGLKELQFMVGIIVDPPLL
jgi:hypothetical protein